MRYLFKAALLMMLLPFLAGAQQSESVCAVTQPNTATADEIILTVCHHTKGMAPVPQPRLYFRLHRSGRIEYEVNPEYDYATGIVDYRLLLKEAKIDARDVDEIIRLGQAADFQSAAAVYPRYQMWTDSSLEAALTFTFEGRLKKVLVNNFSVQDTLNKTHYPPSLLAMLQKVHDLRPPDYPQTVRTLLLNQPEYTATEKFTSSFMGHGFSTTYQTAKHFDCYRRQSATEIIYSCLNQPNVIFYPQTKEYREEPRARGNSAAAIFISDVQTFARVHKDASYKLAGTEMIGEQECMKIEAKVTARNAPNGAQEFTYVFYLAERLKNLVIGVDVTGKNSYASSRLSNIRFDFPEKMFERPTGYRLKRR